MLVFDGDDRSAQLARRRHSACDPVMQREDSAQARLSVTDSRQAQNVDGPGYEQHQDDGHDKHECLAQAAADAPSAHPSTALRGEAARVTRTDLHVSSGSLAD